MSPKARDLALLALASACVRLPLLVLSRGAPFDLESYARVAACPAAGLYVSPALAGRYPYLPAWWALVRLLGRLASRWGGDPGVWFRLPAVAGDSAVACLAYLFAARRAGLPGPTPMGDPRRAGLAAGAVWVLNPLAWIVGAGHGQFDSLVLALVLAAAWLLEYSPHPRGESRAALCLGLAVALKTWPALLLPAFMGVFPAPRDRLRFAAKTLALPAVLPLPWIAADGFRPVWERLAYTGANALGPSGALRAACFALRVDPALWRAADAGYRDAALALIAAAFAWAVSHPRDLRLAAALPWAGLTLALLAPGLSPQYLLWAPALALAWSPGLCLRLSVPALALAAGFYALVLPGVLAGSAAWAPPRPIPGLMFAWAAANLAWWAWSAGQWRRLKVLNVRAARAGG